MRILEENRISHVLFKENGNQYRSEDINKILKELTLESGIKKHVTAHVLRHTCATELYNNGIDPEVIRTHMRHEYESTTWTYIHRDTEEDLEILENNHGNKILYELLSKNRFQPDLGSCKTTYPYCNDSSVFYWAVSIARGCELLGSPEKR